MPLDNFGNYQCVTTAAPAPSITESSPGQLLSDAFVCGHGAPTHTPLRAAQQYENLDTGTIFIWSGGAWSPDPALTS